MTEEKRLDDEVTEGSYPLEDSAGETETLCRDCVFAEYEENTQTGCSLHKLEKFEEQDTEIIEAYDEEGKEFSVIKGRVCVFWRDEKWKNKFQNRDDLQDIVKKETSIRLESIIYLDDKSTQDQLNETFESLERNQFKVVKTTVVDNHSTLEPRDIMNSFRQITENKSLESIRLEQIMEEDASIERCVDICLMKSKLKESTYYTVIRAGQTLPEDFIESLNVSLNEELNRFLLLKPDGNGEGMVVQTHIHKQMGGNKGKSIVEKLDHTTRSQGCNHLVQEISKVVPSMNQK